MPSFLGPRLSSHNHDPNHKEESKGDQQEHVFVTAEFDVAEIHRTVTALSKQPRSHWNPHLAELDNYVRSNDPASPRALPLSVCFKDLATYGQPTGSSSVKTLGQAIWRTLTLQDIYENTVEKFIQPSHAAASRALIHDFSGVCRNGEMTLVLGNPGSGCSTFLRTIASDHSSFARVAGSLDYSGLSSSEIAKNYRCSVVYVPEEDVHLPTLTVRQTLEFALHANTAKKWRYEIPRFIEVFARAFGMSHVMDTMVGDQFIRGVSGGERKRTTILESLASNSSINAWDGSTRGLDASSALDYIRSLRILTDACERATIVSIYQASDAVYNLMDKLILIGEGRMLYNGPAASAEKYFQNLGYERLSGQTMSDFLISISSGRTGASKAATDPKVPKGALNLEAAFRRSQAFRDVQAEIRQYEAEFPQSDAASRKSNGSESTSMEFKNRFNNSKSRFVSKSSSYTTSYFRQTVLCTKREFWQLRNHLAPLFSKLLCTIVVAFLIGSMFYDMPQDTSGVYSRGGFTFYSTVLIGWFQVAEMENSFADRDVVVRQKRYAMIRPSAVVLGKFCYDMATVLVLALSYTIIAYFLAGMKQEPGAFFTFFAAITIAAASLTQFYRVFAQASSRIEIALRYTGILFLAIMVCGGYVRPIHRLMADVPWIGWLAYLTPALYTYEIMMATEFHGTEFACASDSIIPQGLAYGDTAFQGCAYRGVAPGALALNGDAYIAKEFSFSFENVGPDFGILFLFLSGLLALNMILSESIDWSARIHGGSEYANLPRPAVEASKVDEEALDPGPVASAIAPKAEFETTNGSKAITSSFTWKNICYSVQQKRQQKQLLHDISGFCTSGSLTALVGPSGAGKTTLLSVLTDQATGTLSGDLKVNGEQIGPDYSRDIGYCQQMDIHVETSTVREAIEFSAMLRQKSNATTEQRLRDVDEIIETLGMTELQHVLIRSLSLEQKKRVTIAVELGSRPSLLLFLDEPTSGLDSQGAMAVIELLRKLADAGLAIICTIHQAAQEQFEIFDRVLAVNHGGATYYNGKVGEHGADIINYFEKHGIVPEADQNVADFLIDIVSQNSKYTAQNLSELWAGSEEAFAILKSIEELDRSTSRHKELPQLKTGTYASSTLRQTMLLTKRTMQQYWRTPDYIYSRLYCSFFHSLLNGLVFLQLGNSAAELQYRIFACFLVLMIVPEFVTACANMFIDNRNVWLGREAPSRVYGWVAFSTSQIIGEIPWALAGGVLFYLIFYFLIGLPLGAPAGYTFIMMLLFHLFSTSWGQWIAALSADTAMAASIMPFFIVMAEFFNGVLQPQSQMPAVWAYTMYYVGPFTYWISGIVAMILTDLPVQCDDAELSRFQPPPGLTCASYAQDWLQSTTGYLSNPNATSDCGYCKYGMGQDYLSTINVTRSDAWPYLAIFALFTVTNYMSVYLWVYIKSVKNWLPW